MVAEQSGVIDFARDSISYLESTTSDYRRNVANFVPEDSGDIVRYFDSLGLRTVDPCKSGVDTLVLNWYVRLLHPPRSYLEHLDYFRAHDKDGGFTDYEAGGFINGFYFYRHRRDQDTWVAVPDVVCDNYNPCAKFKSIRSSASRTYSQLKNLKGCENIVFLDLTFPKEISNLLYGSDQSRVLEKACESVHRFIELFVENLEGHINEKKSEQIQQKIPNSSTFGYQFNPHPWSSGVPTEPRLHVHLDFLWSFLSEGKLHPLKFHEKGKPVSEKFVKSLWKRAVSQTFDFDYQGKSPDLLLKWAPLSWGGKVLHRLKYRRRKPITDLGEYYLDHDFDPDSFNYGFNEFLLNYSNKTYTYGFWTFLVKLLNDSPNYSANVKICPVCGENVDLELFFPVGEAVFDRVVVLTRSGSAYSVKPPPGGDMNG